MTLQQFIDYALKIKKIEYHSNGGASTHYQCVDLANYYIDKVWGLKAIIGTNAKDFPERLTNGMEFVPNTLEYLPEAGEIVVWNSKVGGGAGHIAVITKKGKQTTFESIDQNWSKKQEITLENHNYTNVRGFIRKKGGMSSMYKGYDLSNKDSMKVAVDVLVRVQSGEFVEKKDYEKEIEQLKKELADKPTGLLTGKRKMLVSLLTPITVIAAKLVAEHLGVEISPQELLYMALAGLAYIGVEGARDLTTTISELKSDTPK